MNGPYETERQARAAALQLAGPPRPGWSILSAEQNRRMLTGACQAARVSLGAFDARIVDWLAGWEDGTCAVVAGLILRAHGAGLDEDQAAVVLSALADAAAGIRERASWCRECRFVPSGQCGECGERLRRAGAYDALAGQLAAAPRQGGR